MGIGLLVAVGLVVGGVYLFTGPGKQPEPSESVQGGPGGNLGNGGPAGNGGGGPGGGTNGASGEFKPVGSWETNEKLLISAEEAAAKLVPNSFHVSPDGKRVAYAIKEGDKFAWVVDGKKGPLDDKVGARSFAFSGDSRRFVYIGRAEGEQLDHNRVAVIVDNKRMSVAVLGNDAYFPESLWTNRDGTEYAFTTQSTASNNWRGLSVYRTNKWFGDSVLEGRSVVQAGNRIAWTPGIYSDSPVIVNGEKVVIPGATPLEYVNHGFCFSENGESYAYVATQDKQQFVVFNGKPQKRFDSIIRGRNGAGTADYQVWPLVLLSADGKHYLHLAADAKQTLVIHDGNRHELPEGPSAQLVLSPDGKRWACHLWKGYVGGLQNCVILDGKKGKDYVSIGESMKPPGVFSPDSKQFAHAAVINVKEKEKDAQGKEREVEKQYAVMVRDGVEQTRFGWVSATPVFSPDGKYLAYLTADIADGKRFMTVDGGRIGAPYAAYHDKVAPSFSPDSKSVAFVAKRDGNWYAVLDGKERTGYDAIGPDGTRVGFTPEGTYTYLANRGGAYYWVEERRK